MGSPQFSIITPSYNHSEFLEETIESVKKQGTDNLEHIVVDGDSTDETQEILKRHENDYNLRWVSEADRGQTHAVNKGIAMASGEFISWQNSDDYYLPGSIETVRSVLAARPTLDMVYGDVNIVDRDRSMVRERHYSIPSRLIQRYHSNFMANQSAFISADVLEAVGPLNEQFELAMDVELFWKLLNYDGDYLHVPEVFSAIRVYDETKSAGDSEEQQVEGQQITNAMDRKSLPEKFVSENTMVQIARIVRGYTLLKDSRYDEVRKRLMS